MVLPFAAGGNPGELIERLTARRHKMHRQLDAMVGERTCLVGLGVLSSMAVAAFRRGELRLEAELRWHEEFESEPARPSRALGGVTVVRQRDAESDPPGEAGTPA